MQVSLKESLWAAALFYYSHYSVDKEDDKFNKKTLFISAAETKRKQQQIMARKSIIQAPKLQVAVVPAAPNRLFCSFLFS